MSTIATAVQFRELLAIAELNIRQQCAKWAEVKMAADIPETVLDEICSVTGQAQLLASQKLTQFSELIDDHEFDRGLNITSLTDLQGFWDMINIQIKEVSRKFDELEEWRQNSWTKLVDVNEARSIRRLSKTDTKKTPKSSPLEMTTMNRNFTPNIGSSSARRYIREVRKRLATPSVECHILNDSSNSPLKTPVRPTMNQHQDTSF